MKNMMKKMLTVSISMSIAVSAFAMEQGKDNAPLLFTQLAQNVVISACADKAQCDFHIVLNKVKQDETTYFSNRPYRFMGEITLDAFVKNWVVGKDSFRADPPNASFVYFDSQDNMVQNIVKLMRPVFDTKANTLSYDLKEVGKNKLYAGTYQHPVLFIDSACLFGGINDPTCQHW